MCCSCVLHRSTTILFATWLAQATALDWTRRAPPSELLFAHAGEEAIKDSVLITFLHGKLVSALPTLAIVEVNGLGYEVLIPLSSFEKLPVPGASVHLLTHLAVREDAHVLYGFATPGERDLFRMLITSVSGIGPKIALNVLSGTSVASFRRAVASGDIRSLSSISGIGKKTAERIVVELKEKCSREGMEETRGASGMDAGRDQTFGDAVQALVALGYKQGEAEKSVKGAHTMLGDGAGVEQLVRAALKK